MWGSLAKCQICENRKITHISLLLLTLLQRPSRKPLMCIYTATSELLNLEKNWLEKLIYEGQGQGHKLSNFKMKKKGIFH